MCYRTNLEVKCYNCIYLNLEYIDCVGVCIVCLEACFFIQLLTSFSLFHLFLFVSSQS